MRQQGGLASKIAASEVAFSWQENLLFYLPSLEARGEATGWVRQKPLAQRNIADGGPEDRSAKFALITSAECLGRRTDSFPLGNPQSSWRCEGIDNLSTARNCRHTGLSRDAPVFRHKWRVFKLSHSSPSDYSRE
ncbi:hypothetical protein BaRGS_00005426 [Batillaria attramentaria]|uniref:Uncharacterized protein n=1 Tax=Batillaria attramentaria TaxID=370345 RepID=A0ABD0LWH3_9CAEN